MWDPLDTDFVEVASKKRENTSNSSKPNKKINPSSSSKSKKK
jgi:hypothetical protein